MAAKIKPRSCLDEVDKDGAFIRIAAGFQETIAPGTRFQPEAGRYHLYIALACPWACGTLTALHFKGLQDVISYSVVHPTWRRTRPDDPEDLHSGWHFRSPGDPPVANELGYGSNDCDNALVPDTVNGCTTVRDLYEKANDETGKYSTPLLWCKKEGTAVCNESLEILKMFDEAFQHLCKHPGNRLFDAAKAKETEDLNAFIYPTVNNGVYRCGFAQAQEPYEKALAELYASLDRLEEQLSESGPFLTGDTFLWIDLRLYHTLVRFDPVYVTYFKTNIKRIQDYPALLQYVRRCYAIPAVKETTNIKHIKMHYFTSHPTLNTYGVIPAHNGPLLENDES